MLGLLRGTVSLHAHEEAWHTCAEETIAMLKALLGETAIDIQHVGSTSIPGLAAKPILDIVIGVQDLNNLDPYVDKLALKNIREARQNLPDQRLFVMGDFEENTRSHHIHAVIWNAAPWKNYILFRDYLRAFDEKRAEYEAEKRRLAALYPNDRNAYTGAKAAMIERLLTEASRWAGGENAAG